ncbi:MAG: nickel transporter permease [Nitrospinota bacterium]|jgi:peptide/nickel transport system permease protein
MSNFKFHDPLSWVPRNSKLFFIGGLIIVSILLAAFFAPIIAPYNPKEQNLYEGLAPPDYKHLFGRDKLGRDILSRVLYGSRISLFVGIIVVSVSSIIGIIVGSLSGYKGGRVDEIIMRFCDILLAFPGILLAIAIMSVLGPNLTNVIVALCITAWVSYARLIRGQILSLREREFILAVDALGGSSYRIILKHLLPNILSPLIVEATFGIAGAIIAESGLSFLGLGVQPPHPSWGSMLNEGRQFLLIAPHLTIFPGIAIMITVLGFNFIGDGIRDLMDVKR